MCSEVPDAFMNKQWLVNESNNVVDDALTGLVKCNPGLAVLDFGRVVVRRDHLSLQKVKIISGGPSGHEPSSSGFVGQGMLTASVQGGIYSSPTTNLVLRTIKELARRHDNGILIIIGNNMGDRLSFGLAMERALNIPNVKIKMLQVADDCNNSDERKGVAGMILVQKIAGAMSEEGYGLCDIHLFCKSFLDNLATISVTLKSSLSPYYEISACAQLLETKQMELGAGFHGEQGFLKLPLLTAHETVKKLLEQIQDTKTNGCLTLDPSIPIVVLVNNLGNSSKIEEQIFINETITQLQNLNLNIAKIYCNSYLTSLEMAGFSLTILNITNPEIIKFLDAPCSAPYWKSFSEIVLPLESSIYLSTVLPDGEKQVKPKRGPRVNDKIAHAIKNAISFACGALISCEKQLNIIDSEKGDSDTGSNLKKGAVYFLDYLSKGKLDTHWPFMLFQQMSKILEINCEGFQCCMYAIMFEAAAKPFFKLTEFDDITAELWLDALTEVCSSVERYGKTSLGKQTMYDSLHAGMKHFMNGLSSGMSSLDAVGLATVHAEEAARNTRHIQQRVHPDPGAHAVGIWMRAVYESLKLQNWPLS